jgi:ubiquinone/menaquinone biosynthesis C-methylase UbiE
MSAPSEPNREQAARWNASAGHAWAELQDVLDRMFAPIEARVVEAGFPGEGGRVLDVGCGAGATTLAMARRLGAAGRCLGVDLSERLVGVAAARARAAGLTSASFVAADAQTYPFEPAGFDAAISRFGVMFFDDPVGAFAAVRRAVRPDGKLAFAAWRSPAENPFMTTAIRAAAPLLPGLAAPDPEAPGQFAFARADRVRQILADAGWTEVDMRPLDVAAALSPPELAEYVTRMGPVGLALQGLDPPARMAVVEAVLPAFEPFLQAGAASFTMAVWLVTARA